MEARYATRKQPLLAECQVAPGDLRAGAAAFDHLHGAFVETFCRPELDQHAHTYIWPALGGGTQKYRIDRVSLWTRPPAPATFYWLGSVGRCALAPGVNAPSRRALRTSRGCVGVRSLRLPQVWDRVRGGAPVVWPSGQGRQRQVAVYLGYVSGAGHTLVDMRLYLPKEWTTDKARLDKAGVPHAHRGYRSRHQLALDMLQTRGTQLPHGWIAGDDEMGRPYWFRRRLDRLGERYMLAVPGNTLIRDLETAPAASSGRRRPPTPPWQRVEAWSASLDEGAWKRIDVRDGSKGPLVVDVVKRRVGARTPRRQQGDEELLVVLRYRDRDNQQVVKVDFYLSNAAPGTPREQLARVAKAEHRIEECLQRSKSEAGLADYEVRHWTGGIITKRCRYSPPGFW